MLGHGKGKLIWDSHNCQKSGKLTQFCCFHLFDIWALSRVNRVTSNFALLSPCFFFFYIFLFLTPIPALELSIKDSVFSLELYCRLVERVEVSPWNLLDMHNIDFLPRTCDEKLWMDPSNLWFNKPFQWFW